jgi:hypothetical protein
VVLPTLEKLLNSIKEWGSYGVLSLRGLMGELKDIRILSLKFFIIASMTLN